MTGICFAYLTSLPFLKLENWLETVEKQDKKSRVVVTNLIGCLALS